MKTNAKVGSHVLKNNGSSVVDYVLCKPDLFDSVYKFEVEEPIILSDQCILNFSFSNHEGVEVLDKKRVSVKIICINGIMIKRLSILTDYNSLS